MYWDDIDKDLDGKYAPEELFDEQGNLVENSVKAVNANISPDQQRQIDLATEQFKQSVTRVDNQILAQYVQAVQNGDYAEAEAILENAQESQQTRTLTFALLTIGVILFPLYARQRFNSLLVKFGLAAVLVKTASSEKTLKQQAEKGAASHVKTIAKDLKKSLDVAIEDEMATSAIEAAVKDKYESLHGKEGKDYMKAVRGDQDIYEYARELILKGESRQNVIKKLQENFAEVGKRRAQVIAGNESNRVFNVSQFEADEQFLAQNKLTDKAYKRLVSNTGHPEAVCKYIIDLTHANPIPFKQDFIPFGKTIEVEDNGKIIKFKASYEHLKSGTIHVNCHCRYELLIKQEDGTFLNTYTWKVENFFDIDSEDRYDTVPEGGGNCRCCDGRGEHDSGSECYGCDGSGLDRDYQGPNPCAGVEENSFAEDKHPRWPKGTPKGGKFMKMADIDVEKYVDLGVELMKGLQKAHDDLDWANSGFGDLETAKQEVEDIKTVMSKHYRKALAANGFTLDDYAKLKHDQLDYSGGGDLRGKDGAYINPPALMKQSGAAMVHTALTRAILSKSNTKFMLYRGQNPEHKSEPKGIVSFTDSKAIAASFGLSTQKKATDVNDIMYHYLLDFDSVHPSEQEVIVQQ